MLKLTAKLYAQALADNAAFDAARQLAIIPATDAPATDAPATDAATDAANGRIAARRLAFTAFRGFADNASIPVKALCDFTKSYQAAFGNAPACKPSYRQAGALTVAAIAAGVKLPTGPDAAPVTFPRRFSLIDTDGAEYAAGIENGCNDNFGKAALIATYAPATELYTVTAKQAEQIIGMLGASTLRKAGAIA